MKWFHFFHHLFIGHLLPEQGIYPENVHMFCILILCCKHPSFGVRTFYVFWSVLAKINFQTWEFLCLLFFFLKPLILHYVVDHLWNVFPELATFILMLMLRIWGKFFVQTWFVLMTVLSYTQNRSMNKAKSMEIKQKCA